MNTNSFRLSHAAVVAFVGWYLMMPPMAADLRPECSPGARVTMSALFLSFLAGTSPRELELRRCDRLRHSVETYAPMTAWPENVSTWRKIGQYETLLECDSQYRTNLSAQPDTASIQNTALSELIQEEKNPITKVDLEDRASAIRKGIENRIRGERCIASDPNLAKD
jgi:hypothetical protein